ncbi:hypothetical protein GXW78_15605 [Roseomonas terrae]|jgi:hypothetical protein|uniref:Uncharacterized protein n=1 Tax=Neoroseomonas terrae TaxID=424799 RepID=A0ABS5EJ94_9PROT|nr:hypothetical protein [Neoroseomonas terrae]MBR0651099.1 hypothetical protein [Neoroseomonas terrae]
MSRQETGGRAAGRRDPREFVSADQDFSALRESMVVEADNGFTRGERRNRIFGARRPDFFEHVNELRSEFIDRSELLVVHAGCVVALRRRLAIDHFQPLYLRLWREQHGFLLHELSLRWLVSACDTLADIGESPVQRALALSGSVLANSMKLTETERRRTDATGAAAAAQGSRGPDGSLFDGMTMFRPGGDMIHNLFRRLARVATLDDVAGPILLEVAARVRKLDTVVRRLDVAAKDPTDGRPS